MLSQWLSDLRTNQPALAEDVAEARRLFWLGSGLSRLQAPDLVDLMKKAVLFLRDRAQSGPEAGEHEQALRRLLQKFAPQEIALYEQAPTTWEPLDLEPLRTRYSEVLSVRVAGKQSNYLLMEAADVPHTYGDPTMIWGRDHELIAILILEGVVRDLASGNWDGLVEAAVAKLGGSQVLLSVHVDADDLREANGPAWLVKFHGCAVRALADPGRYGNAIIATRTQVAEWSTSPAFAHMRTALTGRTQRFRSLILGLSVQDQDLLEIFRFATEGHPWHWNPDYPAYVFAEEELALTQEDVLDICYGDEFNNNRDLVVERSVFSEFAGPLLAAIVMDVVTRKTKAVLARRDELTEELRVGLEAGIDHLENRLVGTVGKRYERLAQFLTRGLSKLTRQFYGIQYFAAGSEYTPLAVGSIGEVSVNPDVTMKGADWLAIGLSLLGAGSSAGWRLRIKEHDSLAFVEVRRPAEEPVLVAITRGAEAADAILGSDVWATGAGVISLVHAAEQPIPNVRSSFSRIGSARIAGDRREVWLRDVIRHSKTASEALSHYVAAGGS